MYNSLPGYIPDHIRLIKTNFLNLLLSKQNVSFMSNYDTICALNSDNASLNPFLHFPNNHSARGKMRSLLSVGY